MAHFVLTIDSDPARRKEFLRHAALHLKSWPDLPIKHAEIGDLAVAWAINPTAPTSSFSETAAFALLLGYAVEDGEWLDAEKISVRWKNPASRDAAFGGYHAAVTYHETGLVIGADLFGFFPIYYCECAGAFLAGTSAEFFHAHPNFSARLDWCGLTGIFLINSELGGRTLFQNVKRLGGGCQLRWEQLAGAKETQTHTLTPHEDFLSLPSAEIHERMEVELKRAIRRHCPKQTATTLMLSGGLDSRLMAGHLMAENITDSATCLGRASDFELQISRRVVAVLGMQLNGENTEIQPAEFASLARQMARWEHLFGGLSNVESFVSGKVAAQAAPMFWSGFALEDVLAADAAWCGRKLEAGGNSFEEFFRRLNAWAFSPELLRGLLRHADAAEMIEHGRECLRHDYERPGESALQRVYRMKLTTRVRFHIGSMLHRISLSCWPLLPVLDHKLLDLCFNLPVELLLDRRAERELLNRRFPKLTAIPREHNLLRLERLDRFGVPMPRKLKKKLTRMENRVRQWYWHKWRKVEPRRYVRLYDFDGPLWRAVRDMAEPHRAGLAEWLTPNVVRELLPAPQVDLKLPNPFAAGGSRRLLLGFTLWLAREKSQF